MHTNHRLIIATAILLATSVYFFAAGRNNAAVTMDDPFDNGSGENATAPRKVIWSP
jgi:hypothetical protein